MNTVEVIDPEYPLELYSRNQPVATDADLIAASVYSNGPEVRRAMFDVLDPADACPDWSDDMRGIYRGVCVICNADATDGYGMTWMQRVQEGFKASLNSFEVEWDPTIRL